MNKVILGLALSLILFSTNYTIHTVNALSVDNIYAATSYSSDPEPVYDITSGSPVNFAQLKTGGWVGPLTSQCNGHLYAATNANGGSLYDITPGGDLTSATPIASNIFGGSLGFIEGLAFDSSGNAYITNSENGMQKIAKVSPGGAISYFPDLYDGARGLAIKDDNLYIVEGGTGKVWQSDLTGSSRTLFASGFSPASDHIAGTMTVDPRGELLLLWSTSNGRGLFDITGGGNFASQSPLVAYTDRFDVNQIGVDKANNVYAAGNGGGNIFVSHFSGGSFGTFGTFTSGLDDTESLAVIKQCNPPSPGIPEFPIPFSMIIIFVAVAAVYMGIRQKMIPGFKSF